PVGDPEQERPGPHRHARGDADGEPARPQGGGGLDQRPGSGNLQREPRASYGQPSPGAGASTMRTWPVRGSANMFSGPFHSWAIMNSVRRSGPPSALAKQPRSNSMVSRTSPPSRTRAHRLFGTSAYQTAPSVS